MDKNTDKDEITLQDISTPLLEQELAHRKEQAIKDDVPKMYPRRSFNYTKLEKVCQEYIDMIASHKHYDLNDMEHYIFEAALEMLFGESVWDWVNEKL